MPSQIRARLRELGWGADLALEAVDDTLPEPSGREVLVAVEACGVCYRDLIDRSGRFPFISLPITPGHEVVGRVLAVGPAAGDWQVGDRVGTMHRDFCGSCPACERGDTSMCEAAAFVLGLTADGGYASHLLAPQSCFFSIPTDIPAEQAAVMHCTFGTAFRGLARFAQIGPGSSVIVTGAAGGVGSAGIQVSTRLGAEVTAVIRKEEHREHVVALGASHVVIDADGTFHKRLPGRPADAVLECVGPPTFNASMRSVTFGGRVVVIGNVVQEKVALNLGYVVTKAVRIFGSSGANRTDMEDLFALHVQRPFEVRTETLELTRADEAQRRLQAGGIRGRMVLIP